MPVAGDGKVSARFCQRKTAKLIDSWSYFYFQTFCDCAILRFWQGLLFPSTIPVILARNILPFFDSGKERKYTQGKTFQKEFRHSVLRSVWHIEPTSSLFTQPAKRTDEFSNQTCVFIRPTCLKSSLNKKIERTLAHDIHWISVFTNQGVNHGKHRHQPFKK